MKWLEKENLNEELRKELETMDQNQLEEAFAGELTFGTAGIRGIMGAGTNRLNIHVIQKVTLGLAKNLINLYPDQEIKVAIGYDSRYKSREFSEEAARVLATYGIKTVMYDRVKPTPMLSFLVRYFKCQAGIMITASHNPKEYNGYKVYNETGAQLNLEQADVLSKEIAKIDDIFAETFIEEYQNFVTYIEPEFDEVYLNAIDDLLHNPIDKKDIKIIFTPVHGTSQDIMPKAFKRYGYENCICVEEQMQPDPEFTNAKSSNPEEIECYEMAIEYAKKHDADLIIANDPDADRLGIMVKHNNKYVAINGNQTGTLLIDYLKTFNQNPNAALYKTIVTGEMGAKIARTANIDVKELLTGFKFIGEQIDMLEKNDQIDNYFFGYEESYGYLISPIARDKDAIQAALLVAEMVNYYLEVENIDLVTKLENLYQEYGYFVEKTHSITLSGIEGLEKIKSVMEYVATNSLEEIIEVPITKTINYNIDETGLPKANVVKFYIENGWFVFRPSGTEPKLKVYISVEGESIEAANKKEESIINKLTNFINNF